MTDWRSEALCAETDPEAFFPEGGRHGLAARLLCGACGVREECLEYALTHDIREGIWGGATAKARDLMRREAA